LVVLGLLGWYNLAYAEQIAPSLLKGLAVTVGLVLIVIPIGFAAGLLVGWSRTSRRWIARAVASTYVEFFRGMPPIVLIFFSWLIATRVLQFYFRVDDPFAIAFTFGVLALGFHSAGYQAEIVRAGILSVPTGQLEAADALGLTPRQRMFHVILPQAFRISLPALSNEFASVIKDTSLISQISAFELTLVGITLVNNATRIDLNLVFIVWAQVALLYLLLTVVATRILRGVENLFKVPGLEAAQP